MIEQLNNFIPVAKKVTSGKIYLPILGCVCISDGLARVTNLELTATMPVDIKANFIIPLKTLIKILATKPKKLSFKAGSNQGDKVIVKFDGQSLSLPVKPISEFPIVPEGKFKSLGRWDSDILGELAIARTYCSTDELKPSLQGVNITQNKGKLRSVVTNGHWLRQRGKMAVDNETEFSSIVPATVFKIFSKADLKGLDVTATDKHLAFNLANDIKIITRLIDERFPDTDSVWPKDCQGKVKFNRVELLDTVKAGNNFANVTTHQGGFTIGDDCQLNVEDIEQDLSWSAPLKPLSVTGEPIVFGFNLDYFQKILKDIDGDSVTIEHVKASSAFVIKGGKAEALLMPIRLND